MCGIAGVVNSHFSEEMLTLVNKINASQRNRGPDHQAVEVIQGSRSAVIFGHTRLSVIDLSEQAHQPLWDVTARYCITYNGEIYNYLELRQELIGLGYSFHTTSDTEVILNAFAQWGIAAIQRFNGPFAFALFDKQLEQLWLVRDRFGVKPLFYYWQKDFLVFASSTRAMVHHFGLTPNLAYVAQGLQSFVYEDDSEQTPYGNMQAVAPGHHFKIDLKQTTISLQKTKYYNLLENVFYLREKLNNDTIKQLTSTLAEKLTQAITLRLRADVPVGISLSGGLDSSSIAALATEQNNALTAFTFGHPERMLSEGPLVKALARQTGLQVEYVWPSAQEMVAALPAVLSVQEAPFATLSIVAQYLLYQRVKDTGIKVLIGGQGGDEALMGYRKFQLFWLQRLLRKKKYGQSILFLLQLLPLVGAELSRYKLYWQQRHRYLKTKGFNSALSLPFPESLNLNCPEVMEPWQRQLQDVTHFSLPTLLRYEDRNSMAHGIESRLPFLDYQMIEFGLALPEAIKLRAGYGKWPLREMIKGKIPETIRTARYKRGFDVPIASLISAGLGKAIRFHLQENNVYIKDFLSFNSNVSQVFCDAHLIAHPSRLSEAITLLWLGGIGRG